MATAEVTFSREQIAGLQHPTTYTGVDWDTYKEISEELNGLRSMRLIYSGGTLTIMPISELHELLSYFLGQFMGLVSIATKTNIIPTGSATLRSKSKLIGVEPDLSFFVSNAERHQIKDYVPDEIGLSPDIVIEIDLTHSSDDKFDIYSDLGVSEFWQYDGEKMKMYWLDENRAYISIDRSLEIPILTTQVLTEFLNRSKNDGQPYILLSDFQEWLKNAK